MIDNNRFCITVKDPNIRRFGYSRNIIEGFSEEQIEKMQADVPASYIFYEYYEFSDDYSETCKSPGREFLAVMPDEYRQTLPELSDDMIIMYIDALYGKYPESVHRLIACLQGKISIRMARLTSSPGLDFDNPVFELASNIMLAIHIGTTTWEDLRELAKRKYTYIT